MSIAYSEWPETLTCPDCGDERPAASRDDCYDGFPPSLQCDACGNREAFFWLLHLKRVHRRSYYGSRQHERQVTR